MLMPADAKTPMTTDKYGVNLAVSTQNILSYPGFRPTS